MAPSELAMQWAAQYLHAHIDHLALQRVRFEWGGHAAFLFTVCCVHQL